MRIIVVRPIRGGSGLHLARLPLARGSPFSSPLLIGLVALALLLAACDQDLPKASEIANLRIIGMRAAPAEGVPGVEVMLDSLVVDVDPAEDIDRVWMACVSAAGAIALTGCVDPEMPEAPPLCTDAPEARACVIGFGQEVDYRLPALALEGRAPDEPGQVIVTLVAARNDEGGLNACLDGFEDTGVVPEFCRIGVKRVNVLREGMPQNRNPLFETIFMEGDHVQVTLAPDAIEDTPDGPEKAFLSWYVTAGEILWFRTDADSVANSWTPPDTPGRIYVVVRDGRGGESWIDAERP